MTKKLVQEHIVLEDEINEHSLNAVIDFLVRIKGRHEGLPEDTKFSISEWASVTYQRWETDDEEAKREAEEAREKHKRHVQYLKLKEEFEPNG